MSILDYLDNTMNLFKKPENEELWKQVKSLWDDGESKQPEVQKYFDYWNGKIPNPAFPDQDKTQDNIVKQIVEAKLTAMLDAQFTVNVVPAVTVYADIQSIRAQQSVADVFNAELHNILERNRFDDLKEKVGRWGIICGFGPSQVTWDKELAAEGDVKVDYIDPRNIRWDKNANRVEDSPFFAYKIELNSMLAKKRYGLNPDGTINEELCNIIDQLAECKTERSSGERGGVVAVSSNETSNLAYSEKGGKISNGKIVELVVMFLMDDTVFMPEKGDNEAEKAMKEEERAKYPNGRMIVFALDEKKKLILDDRPAPNAFKALGNIDIFNPVDFNSIAGKGEVEDLVPIQDRINGAMSKVRQLIHNHISAIVLDKGRDMDVEEDSVVNHPVIFLDGVGSDRSRAPGLITNNGIEQAMKLTEYINTLKVEAMETARVNDTMLNGARQTGTTSAEQVDALQESPMSAIRAMQRNFKDYVIRVGEKVIALIQEYYTVSRLIKLSTGVFVGDVEAKYAKMSASGDDQNIQRSIELLDEAGRVIQSIKMDDNWKFKVEVTAGTEIPRSRRENAALMDRLFSSGILGDPMDLDVKEQYLRSTDVPNYRAFIALAKRKQEQLMKNPPQTTYKEILTDPNLAKAFAEIISALDVNSVAKGQVLAAVGLDPKVDNFDTAPIQDLTSRGDVTEVAAIAPQVMSDDPAKAQVQHQTAVDLVRAEKGGV